jgi:hypothetical protein
MHKNILTVVGITILFLGVGIQPAIAEGLSYINNEYQPSKLLWKTYTNCKITGVFWNIRWPPPLSRNLFAFVVIIPYFKSCELSGYKGTYSISQIIGFGFIGNIQHSYVPHIPSNIDGRLLFCIFKENPNTKDITN